MNNKLRCPSSADIAVHIPPRNANKLPGSWSVNPINVMSTYSKTDRWGSSEANLVRSLAELEHHWWYPRCILCWIWRSMGQYLMEQRTVRRSDAVEWMWGCINSPVFSILMASYSNVCPRLVAETLRIRRLFKANMPTNRNPDTIFALLHRNLRLLRLLL